MSRSLFISLVASVVAVSAQAGYKEQALELGTKVASYLPTAKNAGIVATVGVVGYGLKKAYNYCTKPSEQKPNTTQQCLELTQKMKQQTASSKKAVSVEQQPSRVSRMWANRPSLKTVGKTAVAATVAGAMYYFRGGLVNGLTTVASKVWNVMPSQEAIMKINPVTFSTK